MPSGQETAMDWSRQASALLLAALALPATLAGAADPAQLVETRFTEIAIPITVKHSPLWTAVPATYRNARELVVIRKERMQTDGRDSTREVYDARMLITSEPRKNRADALKRLSEIAVEHRGAAGFVGIGGWPAVEIRFVEPLVLRGSDAPPPAFGHRMITAVAAADRIVRFDVSLLPGGSLQLLQEAEAIAHSTVFPTQDKPATLNANLRELNRKLLERRLQSMRPSSPASSMSAATGTTVLEAASGAPAAVPHAGLGELEIATSANADAIVIASNGKVAFSADQATTFTASVHGPFTPRDPTLARGASGNFYFGTLGTADGSAAHLGISGCTDAVSRSTDGGASFALRGYSATCPLTGAGMCFPDQPHIAAEPVTTTASGNDQLYAVWRDLRPTGAEADCTKVIITPYRYPTASCSLDSGMNWSAGALIPGAGDFPRVAVARDGSVFVVSLSGDAILLYRYTSCASGFTLVTGYPVTVATLTGQVACPVPGLDRCNNGNTLSSPTVAPDPADASHVFVAFAELDGTGGERVVVVESRDAGASFPRRTTISGTMPARRFMPWACSTRGDAYVGWYDRRAALATGASNDLTDYFVGVARSLGGGSPSLTAGAERNLTNNPDPHCASWRCSPRKSDDSESCSVQPQMAGFCLSSPSATSTAATQRCDFSDGGCPAGLFCYTKGGCPKYGDYNGIACATNWVIAAWASGTAPSGLAAASGLGVYATAQYVGPYVLDFCKTLPLACVPPSGFGKDLLRLKCKHVPCIVVDPIPRNCLAKWTCPGCRAGGLCPPFYHVVFDDTLGPWKVGLIDGKGRLVAHDLRRVGRNTVLTVRPLRDADIADYRLVFTAVDGIRPGVEYTIRTRLETSDSAVLDLARTRR
jgi:hypothetical protein